VPLELAKFKNYFFGSNSF